MGGVIFFLCLYFVVPILIAKVVLGATLHAILVAYAVWFGVLLLWGLSSAKKVDEGIGWAMIMGMFLTVIAIPILVTALKLVTVN